MSQVMDHVEYLSKKIGPRPAGTEEERKAALYLAEQFQQDAGFQAAVEDFSSSSNFEAGLAVLAGVAVVATVLAMIFPVLAIPAFVLATAAAVVYALEHLDRPIISRVLSRGASQNVIAKYQPGGEAEAAAEQPVRRRGASSRKIILVAHYDTGRVSSPVVERIESSSLPVSFICVGGMIAAAFFLLLRIFVAPGGGMGLLVLNVLSAIAVVACLYPIVKAILLRSAPYNEGAVNNASGTAALLEVARRIARGSVNEADLVELADDGITVHGEAAAREAGLIPAGVQIEYEAGQIAEPAGLADRSEEERLLSAKAAIAALTGQPVERRIYGSVAENLVNSRVEGPGEPVDFESAGFAAPSQADDISANFREESVPALARQSAPEFDHVSVPASEAGGFENAPSWFVAAQQNAKRSERFNADEAPEIKRSRYTEAIENAERERYAIEEELRAAEQRKREEELRIREEEARAVLAAQAEAEAARVAEVVEASATGAIEPAQDASAATAEVAPVPVGQAQGPSGTAAIPAPEPAAEVVADAAALAAQADVAAQQPEPVPVQGRVVNLPAVESAVPREPEPVKSPSRSGILRNLRASVPSLSGIISGNKSSADDEAAAAERQAAARRSVASVPSVTAIPQVQPAAQPEPLPEIAPEPQPAARFEPEPQPAFQPEPLPEPAPESEPEPEPLPDLQPVPDLVPLDADTHGAHEARSAARSSSQGASRASSPRQPVELPQSRSGSLLNRLRKNNEEELADTPQQWLDVDDDFEARNVGRERGSWESFRDDQYFDEDDGFGDFGSGDDAGSGRRWQGGAYSTQGLASRVSVGYANTHSGPEEVVDPSESGPLSVQNPDPELESEIKQIFHFRNPQFSNEVWFVAIGADGEAHDGARAFLEEHRDELRGSMVIEVESLGAGELAVSSDEGRVRKVQASSRVKRFTRAATAATGLAPDSVSLAGTDSISSTVQKAGFQSMHLFGAEDGRPALKGSADDVLENLDEALYEEHLNYLYELLKS